MRSTISEKKVLKDDDDKFLGFNFGWNFVAEHEFGIEDIVDTYGLNKEGLVSKDNEYLYLTSFKTKYGDCPTLVSLEFEPGKQCFNEDGSFDNKVIPLLDFDMSQLEKDDFVAAWDDHSFGICVKPELKNELTKIYEAIKNKTARMGLLKLTNNPFSNAGFAILLSEN